MKTEAEFLEILRHKKENLRKQHKKNILLSIVLVGTGPLHRLCTQEGVRKLWLQESQSEEKSKSIFVMPIAWCVIRDLALIWLNVDCYPMW